MRIIRLEFENLNSLRGKHVIDFDEEPLRSSGLFLISGPTGSGKSTILDAITLALFNRIPRFAGGISVNEIKKSGSVVTQFESHAKSSIFYESNGVHYCSSWSLSKNRNDNWNDYHMEIYTVANEKIMDLKRSRVPNMNESIIGLSYDQFLKSILLSQGQFAQFLKADSNKRGALLEKLTGTEIYRHIGALAYQKFKDQKTKIEVELAEINAIPLLNEEELNDISIKEKESATLAQSLNEKYTNKLNHFNQLKSIDNLELSVKSNLVKLSKIDEEIERFKPNQNKLDLHETIAPFHSDISLLLAKQKEEHTVLKEIDSASTKIKLNEQLIEQLITKLAEVARKEVNSADFYVVMKNVEKEYSEITSAIKYCKAEGQNIRQKINDVNTGNIVLPADPKAASQFIQRRVEAYHAQVSKEEALRIYDLIQRKNAELQKLEQCVRYSIEIHSLTQENEENSTQLNTLQKTLIESEKRSATSEQKIVQYAKELEEKDNQIKEGLKQVNLSDLRNQLVEDEACPLCGSTTHPFATHQVLIDHGKLSLEYHALKEALANERKTHQELSKSVIASKTTVDSLTANERVVQQKISTLKETSVNEGYELIIKEKIKDKQKELETGKTEITRLSELAKLQDEVNILKQLKGYYTEMDATLIKFRELEERRKQFYPDGDLLDYTNQLQDEFSGSKEALSASKEALEINLAKSKQLKSDLTTIADSLAPLLQKLEVSSISEVSNMILSSEEHQALKYKKDNLLKVQSEIDGSLKQLRKELLLAREKITNTDTTTEVEAQVLELKAQMEEMQVVYGKFQQQLLTQTQNQKLKSSKEDKIKDEKVILQKWEKLNAIIGDAKGNRFANFAQDLTLQVLINIANHHLAKLSDRYLLVPTSIEEGLSVYDTYQGDTIRAIETLSGGETFIVSLAMAVSLSELASRNVQLESIFIDEGFGSLDAESLEQAMSTLEVLQATNNKTIGIISHVESLKERITSQIQLTKNSRGHSQINILIT